jgi:hypothetical protein
MRTAGGQHLGKYMNKKWGEVLSDARKGNVSARSVRKLLTSNEYKK